jgi:NACHT domain
MNLLVNALIDELAVFADVGTVPPKQESYGNSTILRFVKNGEPVALRFEEDGSVFERRGGGEEEKHSSYRALLASDGFANLRVWASSQYDFLRQTVDEERLLPFEGVLAAKGEAAQPTTLEAVEQHLSSPPRDEGTNIRVLLVDGPAGIGKTALIERLAYRRARDYRTTGRPLVLHVKSRGRILTYLQDLMAFSLQTLRRVPVTFDQVPVLVRHGLVVLAIDGFDELADPNGYDNAWAQVRDLAQQIEGDGALILAGRETFIGRDRLLKAVPRLATPTSNVAILTLQPVKPHTATQWLKRQGWNDEQIKTAEDWEFFEEGSYALRPFFLAQLAELAGPAAEALPSYPLAFLVARMVEREATKFGEQVERSLSLPQRKQFVYDLLGEVARDMAENQTDSIDEESLRWIVELVLGQEIDPDVSAILKNRAAVVAFLQNDDRAGRRKFAHTELFNFFLADTTISAVCKQEIPKFLRRNILGSDFLIIFGMVLASSRVDRVKQFLETSAPLAMSYGSIDRGGRNVGALLFAALPVANATDNFVIRAVDVDDAVITGTAQAALISNVTVNQLDAKEADVSAVRFENCNVAALVAADISRVSSSFPDVAWIELVEPGSERSIMDEKEIRAWIDRHGRLREEEQSGLPTKVLEHGLYRLLQRVCRVMLRQHWIRSDGDDYVTKLVADSWWGRLQELLSENGLLQVKQNKPASGPPSSFFHIRHAREILALESSNQQVRNLMSQVKAIAEGAVA